MQSGTEEGKAEYIPLLKILKSIFLTAILRAVIAFASYDTHV